MGSTVRSIFNRKLRQAHRNVFLDHPLATFLTSYLVYVAGILFLSGFLQIASNYLIALPVIVAALAGGLKGGLAAGALGLPSNLFLFWLLGHLDYSPANKYVAEVFGLVIGGSLGYLSDYFRFLEKENAERLEAEVKLTQALKDKEWLLGEIQHRVKNNLAVIRGLVQLQSRRSDNLEFKKSAAELTQRIQLIARIQDRLYPEQPTSCIDLEDYVRGLCQDITNSLALTHVDLDLHFDCQGQCIDTGRAAHLGFILNEVIVNALKHAFHRVTAPRLRVSLVFLTPHWQLEVRDNGPGLSDQTGKTGLGLKLIDTFTKSLEGTSQYYYDAENVFLLEFPHNSEQAI